MSSNVFWLTVLPLAWHTVSSVCLSSVCVCDILYCSETVRLS